MLLEQRKVGCACAETCVSEGAGVCSEEDGREADAVAYNIAARAGRWCKSGVWEKMGEVVGVVLR
jgi:hypothetical protein